MVRLFSGQKAAESLARVFFKRHFGGFPVMMSGDSIGSNKLSLSFDGQTRKQGWAFVRQWIM
jgi:hypothetical protein